MLQTNELNKSNESNKWLSKQLIHNWMEEQVRLQSADWPLNAAWLRLALYPAQIDECKFLF